VACEAMAAEKREREALIQRKATLYSRAVAAFVAAFPDLLHAPLTIGTPTHASTRLALSLSLSLANSQVRLVVGHTRRSSAMSGAGKPAGHAHRLARRRVQRPRHPHGDPPPIPPPPRRHPRTTFHCPSRVVCVVCVVPCCVLIAIACKQEEHTFIIKNANPAFPEVVIDSTRLQRDSGYVPTTKPRRYVECKRCGM
jgi:hypothetical protein